MLDKGRRLKKNELNTLFINGLDSMVSSHSGEDSAPLLIDLAAPLSLKLRVYLLRFQPEQKLQRQKGCFMIKSAFFMMKVVML